MLEGVKVIDLSQYIPGPFATRQLADLGANVIKIEPPAGDPMRRFMLQNDDSISPVYQHLNRGKRIARLDLKSEPGKEYLTSLLAEADVLLSSYRTGVLERLGFSNSQLKLINPRLIHCALSGYGQTGPYQERAGHDINYLAASGVLSVCGTEEKPVMPYPPLCDHAGAMQACTATLAALLAREKNGQGAMLDISLFESSLAWNYLPVTTNTSTRTAEIINGGAAYYNIYRCADGAFVTLGALETHFWDRFCSTVKQPGWIKRHNETLPQQALIKEVSELLTSKPVSHWNQLLAKVDCCYEPVVAITDLAQHPQVEARNMINQAGPCYAGKINQHSVSIKSHVNEVAGDSSLCW
ncbi:MAG: CoA transferase [Gammaproteobacteria bacterium]|nr:CoA transferase [Gammaproteobacteria bacterium]